MSDEKENENLAKAADFFGGMSNVRDTSKVTHQAIYTDVLGALMERVMEIEKMIAEHAAKLESVEEKIDAIEKKLNVIIISFWVMLGLLVIFCIVAINQD